MFFCSFVDFSKAFDRANYWKLFNKLLDDNVAYDIVKLLSFWYSHQISRSLYAGRIPNLSPLAFKMALDKAPFYHLFFLHATSARYCLV